MRIGRGDFGSISREDSARGEAYRRWGNSSEGVKMVFQVGALFIALPVGLVFAGSVLFGDHSLKTILIAGGLLGFVAWAFIPRSRKKSNR